MPAVQPIILTWARQTAGLSLDEAARLLGLQSSHGRSASERLAAYEAGAEEPSRPLLVKMAERYRRPLLVFYLSGPPRTGDRGRDFRTLPGSQRYNPSLDVLVRDIKARQGIIRSMLEDTEDGQPLDFIASATTGVSVETLCSRIARRLEFSLSDFRARKTSDEAFTYLRNVIERSGVFVLLVGNLGSHHSNIPVNFFRGFALADPIAPMIVINDRDARPAWSFTALHEVVHLWLGQTGISGIDTDNAVEQYCNDVAGELLLPTREVEELKTEFDRKPRLDHIVELVREFAAYRHVSRSMVVYKLLRAGMIGRPLWSDLDTRFTNEWRASKEREAEKGKTAEGGPNYYVVRRHRVGPAILDLVRRSLNEGTTTYTKAGRVLGVKPRNVEPLLSLGPARGAR